MPNPAFPIAAVLALSLLLAPAARAQEALDLDADRLEAVEGGIIRAEGDVKLVVDGLTLTGSRLDFDQATRRGRLTGPVAVSGRGLALTAEAARIDLAAEVAELEGFRGRVGDRAQFAGARLSLTRRVYTLEGGFITPCMASEPDISLAAERIRYYPGAENLNLTAENVALKVWNLPVVALPFFTTTVRPRRDPAWAYGDVLPRFGFDVYQGFLSSAQLPFSLGEGSRGTLPIVYSTGRGLRAGIEHALAAGPGEILTSAQAETPWAVDRGGFRFANAYRVPAPGGGRFDLAADYRAELNGQPVHRLPEASWLPAPLTVAGALGVAPELRAAYMVEESSSVRSARLRAAAPFYTPAFDVIPGWQTWLSGVGFVNAYAPGFFGGLAGGWHHRQSLPFGVSVGETLELSRLGGETPFIHDRLYDAERVRVEASKQWGRSLFTTASTSFSRVNQAGRFGVEDLFFAATYRWNCFGVTASFRPLVLGVELNAQLLNF